MKKSYPALANHINILKNPPKSHCCLCGREIETIKNLNNLVIFLWLKNGKGFWYHVYYVNGDILVGYKLFNKKWHFQKIHIKNILSYY